MLKILIFFVFASSTSFGQGEGVGRLQDTPKAPVKIEDSFFSGLMDEGAKKVIGEFLAENPFSKVPREELKALLTARLHGLPLGGVMENNPKLLNMSVDLVRDESAIPSFLSIVNKPEKVKTYGYVLIGVFVLVFILNLMNNKGNIFKRIFAKMLIGLGAFVVNLAAAFIIFREEISPSLDIIFKYYHL